MSAFAANITHVYATRVRRHLLWFCAAIAIATAFAWLRGGWTVSAEVLVLALATLSTGMLHGALDVLLLAATRGAATRWAIARRIMIYVIVATAACALFSQSIEITLLILLAASIWHFGESAPPSLGGERRSLSLRLVLGGAPVLLPALLSAGELNALLSQTLRADGLVSAAHVLAVWRTLAFAWLIVTVAAIGLALWRRPAGNVEKAQRIAHALELGAIATANVLLPPLVAFALYFAFYHAANHMAAVHAWTSRQTSRYPRWWAVAATFVAIVVVAIVALWQQHAAALTLPVAALQAFIAVIAALSVPHVALIGWWSRDTA